MRLGQAGKVDRASVASEVTIGKADPAKRFIAPTK
jgi:hypothetical protein